MGYPERIVPDDTPAGVVALHVKRYAFAAPWCENVDVLDVGCGVGYGTAVLAAVARRAVGGDVDEDSIRYARQRYVQSNVDFVVLDATELPFEDATFDVVCSFETIEHVHAPDALVGEAARVLCPSGTFLVSTPKADLTTHSPENPFHRIEFSRTDFEALLRTRFATVDLYGERRPQTLLHRAAQRLDVLGLRRRSAFLRRASSLTGTRATEHLELNDIVIAREGLERASVLYAVCTGPRR